ncbi:MAG: glycoside hydrolase family 3 C-terminal domain-containing protein [Bacteroidales bacterium]|nr:glycoside hydrolase family 3 C-terminal domain-containing protein [Bacteroidales bacterium]
MKKILLLAVALLTTATAFAQPKLTKDNIDEVIKAMTLQEKATLLVGGSRAAIVNGVTSGTTSMVDGAAGRTRAIDRLGIPATVLADGPAGLRISPTRRDTDQTFYCTAFPVGTSLASSWDIALVEELTTAMGQEVREYGVDVLLAPGMNIHRNVLCGRNFEYFSEDPLVSGKMAAAYVRGIQSNGVGTSIKHFMANNQETNRNMNDALISQRALREIYLKNFEICVKEGKPWTVMSSYNQMNGQFTQQNRELLTTVLREEWGFDGIVMTDWGNKEGTVKAVNAQNDLMEPGAESEIERIIKGVQDGTISQADLDRNVRNMLEYIVRTPRFAGYKFSNKPDLAAHEALVRKAATQTMVLLKNDNATLPLKGNEKVALFGLTSYDMIPGGTGSGAVNKKYVRSLKEGLEMDGFKVDADLANLYDKYVDYQNAAQLRTAGGGGMWGRAPLAEMEVPEAYVTRELAATDVAIITIGRNAGEGADRKAVAGDWALTASERANLEALCSAYHAEGKKVIVVLNIGGAIETASWKHMPDAILLAWQPGMEAGASIADVLCGKANPSGKLATTFPMNFFDSPSSRDFPYNYTRPQNNNQFGGMGGPGGRQPQPVKDVDYTEYRDGIWVGYRYFETAGKEVSYPFGFGLSYTTFEYSKPVVKATANGFTATITVRNTGKVAGREAVQLYVTAPAGGLEKPTKELKAFAKTRELAPGESQTLTMTIDNYSLASFNEAASQWEAAAGNYTVAFAASVKDVRATATYSLKKAQNWKVNNVLAPLEPVREIAVK